MLDIGFILENRDLVIAAVQNKKGDPVDIDALQALHVKRVGLIKDLGEINRERKEAAASRDDATGSDLKKKAAEAEEAVREVTKELTDLLAKVPNIPSPDVPVGASEDDNVVIRQWGEKPTFDFKVKAHWDIGAERDFIDSERAANVAGSRFTYLKGGIVRLQVALVQWVFDTVSNETVLTEVAKQHEINVPSKPFVPVLPPVMITPEMLFGMARLDPKEDKYYLQEDNLFLAGSAEHTLGAMHAGEVFEEDALPIRYVGYSTAFRREAGSYGKDTKGILRQHQFDKLEFESFTVGERSRAEQDFLVALQEHLMQQLNLPYQVVMVCTGDMGKPDVRQIDIETWMPGQNTYRETHSADLMGAYQARRLGIRVKREGGKKEFVHMNDATVFAMGRTLIAIIENNQRSDGSVTVPEVLRPYLGNQECV
ncbi:MAG: serine--tRNA ligase [Candidatus Kaiserbacteria bacterium]|nr:serine--tRNA ligase [Candidatus Kaiserbacteria bacterium]